MIPARVSALAFAAALGLAAVSHAQPAPPPPPPPGSLATHHWDRDGAADPREAHGAGRLKALHDALNIRPDQEAAFLAFAASMRPEQPEGMAGPDGRGPGMEAHAAGLTAPERADQMLKHFDEHTGRMRQALVRHAEAVKTFYAALSPEQRRTLDALATLVGRPGRPMGHGMRGLEGHDMEGHGMGPGHPGEPG